MATLNLVRGVWQKEFTTSAAASGANTYVLSSTDTGILIKVEGATNSGSAKIRVRWIDASGLTTFVEDFTANLDAANDTAGVSQATYHQMTMIRVPRPPAKSVKIDVRTLTTVATVSAWITAY